MFPELHVSLHHGKTWIESSLVLVNPHEEACSPLVLLCTKNEIVASFQTYICRYFSSTFILNESISEPQISSYTVTI